MISQLVVLWMIIGIVICFNCPLGTTPVAGCGTCAAPSKCYKDGTASYCCDSKFCTDTKLASFYGDNPPHDLNVPDTKLNDIWAKRTGYSCPIPYPSFFAIEYRNAKNAKDDIVKLDEQEKYPFNKDGAQWKTDGSVTVLPCAKNEDCAHLTDTDYIGYCSKSYNPSLSISAYIDETKFCYKLKVPTNSSYLLDNAADGVTTCTTECTSATYPEGSSPDEWVCLADNRYTKGGVCLRNKACSDGSYAYGLSTGKCTLGTDSSCPVRASADATKSYFTSCNSIAVGATQTNLCCQEEAPKCALGDAFTPKKTCSSTQDCNTDPLDHDVVETYNKWCDKTQKLCCHSKKDEKLLYCPDHATPLHYQDECKSGSCENGDCLNGHCCPKTKLVVGVPTLGETSIMTKQTCDKTVPKRFIFAYCDDKDKRIVVIGEKGLDGKKLVKSSTKCVENKECDGGHCVQVKDGEKVCYGPEKAKEEEGISLWMYIGGGVGVLAVVGVIVGGTVYALKKGVIGKKGKDTKSKEGAGKPAGSSETPTTGTTPAAAPTAGTTDTPSTQPSDGAQKTAPAEFPTPAQQTGTEQPPPA